MTAEALFEQMDFREDPLLEKMISDISEYHYSIIDDFFSEEEIALFRTSLLSKYEEDRFKKSAIGDHFHEQIKAGIRGDFILWINEQEASAAEKRFFDRINHMVSYLNRTCFMGILQKEFHYALYPEGTFYKRHLDTFQNDDRRKLSMVCYLNDHDWKLENGGELRIFFEENGKESFTDICPMPGRVVIFESQLLEHEVRTVLASERLSITGWMKTR
ncbi:2OG-Fe(II) oxygenase [Robertkochia solimangrovi]|uniref:2OG-Fe(II) oxygenase n=1 Tax=Robertkochia solimangrovi TaxID=2213046 RepID=UPI001180BAF6|nr:2OG-Fe(II) oxygenase [Robertkochia solimangrovi]TRZ46141.1 oxidoreductase [Robertkochia solimangrovi]